MTNVITRDHLERSVSYASFRDLINSLLIERKTTGAQQTKERVQSTRLNARLMDRIGHQTVLMPELLDALRKMRERQIWLGLVEAWCMDVAQNIPVIAQMAVSVPTVSLRLLLRDEHPDIMDAYLTNGSKSIPKIIALKEDTLEELWAWGPRPEAAQTLFMDLKNQGEPMPAVYEAIQSWYSEDKNQTLQHEFFNRIRSGE
ncbi:MAG: thioredoxin family protein [Balneolales bacterium]